MSYYILQDDETKGPYTMGQLRAMWNAGQLTAETLHCQEGDSEWRPLTAILDELEPPPMPPRDEVPAVAVAGRNTQTRTFLAVSALVVVAMLIWGGLHRQREKEIEAACNRAGVSVAAVRQLAADFGENDVLKMAMRLESVNKTMHEAMADPNSEAEAAMRELGLSANKFRTADEYFREVIARVRAAEGAP